MQESQVKAQRSEDDPFALRGRHGIVCEIGVGLDQGVTSFGAFLNISNDLNEMRQFGRGLRGERISSLNAERVRPTLVPQVRATLIANLCEQLGYPEYHVHTGHPFLRRVSQAVPVDQAENDQV